MSDTQQGPDWWLASDGKWYPPQPTSPTPPPPPSGFGQPPVGYTPQPPSKPGMNGCLKAFLIVGAIGLVLVIVLGIVTAIAVDDAVDDQEDRQGEIDDDATLQECAPDELGQMNAVIAITNSSSDRSNYSVEVAFTAPGGAEQLDTGIAFVNGLASGQSRTTEVMTFTVPTGEFECDIIEVTRFSDEP